MAPDYLDAPEQLSRQSVMKSLKPILESQVIGKIGQNLKYDAHILANIGIFSHLHIQLKHGKPSKKKYVYSKSPTGTDSWSMKLKINSHFLVKVLGKNYCIPVKNQF